MQPARLYNAAEAENALGTLAEGPWLGGLRAAAGGAPYLATLCMRYPELAARLNASGPLAIGSEALDQTRAAASLPFDEAMVAMRQAKAATHLACAVGDLSAAWSLEQVTGALTDLADAACESAIMLAANALITRGDLVQSASHSAGPLPGLIVLAMGKQGARELNYSSDIDITLFFDPELFPVAHGREPKVVAQRLAPLIARALEEMTADGYVFRTDFRLRPDPASTPVIVSTAAAEGYYQSVGQNWERAAFIKARPCAGDIAEGEAFLRAIAPFIWRRHLDYAAIADIHSIKRQILAAHKGGDLDEAAPDVKLGRGGIRDIELFAQTQQLILGGRDQRLRARDTIGTLRALSDADVIDAPTRDDLIEAYEFLRSVEHRIQMLNDEQTHRVPAGAEMRARLAALCGFENADKFDAALRKRRARVAEIDGCLFRDEDTLADSLGSLIFTGVEDDSETLAALGFSHPDRVAAAVRGWHHGRFRATRTERAREILTALMPKLLRAIAESGEADIAFARFDDFLKGLPAGVQVLSLLAAQPTLLGAIADAFGLAPKISAALARKPALIDAILDPRFAGNIGDDAQGDRIEFLDQRIAGASFEDALNLTRRFQAEETLRIGLQVLQQRASTEASGHAHADLAEACVRALSRAALVETERLYGRQPGAFVVLALGKFGGQEMAEGSDLDVMVVYDAAEGVAGKLSATEFYARFTQRLISALSAPTEEGTLYAVDMQLRPSGSKGPVAVRLSSFQHYYAEDAWTWELQALTRARPVAGDDGLARRVMQAAHAALLKPRDKSAILAAVADMRALMERERPGKNVWDLKLAPGGLVDIEFAVQGLQLIAAADGVDLIHANTATALAGLAKAGRVSPADGMALTDAWRLYSDLIQVLRICVDEPMTPDAYSGRLRALLASIAGVADFDFEALEARLRAVQVDIRARFRRLLSSDGAQAQAAR
jgi:glutamate-ammonia-ligase adenylyltransferase